MQTKLPTTKKQYKTFDHSDAIRQAQELIDNTKTQNENLRSIRIDADTIVQIKADNPNFEQVIKRIKNKVRTVSIVDLIEYGQYA